MNDKYKMPTTSLISFMSNKVKSGGGINFAQGIPGFAPPKELLNCLSEISLNPTVHQYAHGQGNSELLDLLFDSFKEKGSFERKQFRITDGATEAIWIIFNYLNYIIKEDFGALAFDPVYESYRHLPAIFDKKFVAFQLKNDLSIDFDKLEKEIINSSIRVIFVGSPGNPLGKVWTKKEFEILHNLCKKHNIYMIVDAVYRDFSFENDAYQPLDILDKYIFYVDSFSKMLSVTGWRVGYYITHPSHIDKLGYVHDYTGLSSPSVQQMAIAKYLSEYDFGKEYVCWVKDLLAKTFHIMKNGLCKLGFDVPEIEGGYFIWATLPEKFQDGFHFAVDLYDKEHVAVIPGIHFSENGKKQIRINIARPIDEIEEGLKRISSFVNCG